MSIKFNEFIRVARYLNNEVGITPLLFGSLGLEQRINMDLNADDIDVLIPQIFTDNKWDLFKEKIVELGYSLIDLEEHMFHNNKFKLAFANIEGLTLFANINLEDIQVINSEDAQFMLLTLPQYLSVYNASSKDGYRRNKNNNKDFEKIAIIKQQLGLL